MTDERKTLKAAIETVMEAIKHLSVDDAADLIAELSDETAGDRTDDLFHGAILDGIRWGHHAAVTVEMGGGAILRVILPGGIGITHEWADDADADAQIKAALAAIHAERTTPHWRLSMRSARRRKGLETTMTDTPDTSREAVERLAERARSHDIRATGDRIAATLRALLSQRDSARAEGRAERLRKAAEIARTNWQTWDDDTIIDCDATACEWIAAAIRDVADRDEEKAI